MNNLVAKEICREPKITDLGCRSSELLSKTGRTTGSHGLLGIDIDKSTDRTSLSNGSICTRNL